MTNYKEMMNGKREIPISSCSSQIEDLVYGTGSVLHTPDEDPPAFENTSEQSSAPKKVKKAMKSEREQKLQNIKK